MKGILFKSDTIQAIVDGRKTQTRRLGGLKEINRTSDIWECLNPTARQLVTFYNEGTAFCTRVKPRYQVGETVYIKEAIHRFNVEYASYSLDFAPVMFMQSANRFHWRWARDKLSPRSLPREAARYFIMITDVGVERLQEISWLDCLAEGIQEDRDGFFYRCHYSVPQGAYIELWNSINKQKWESNPWVWVYSFEPKET